MAIAAGAWLAWRARLASALRIERELTLMDGQPIGDGALIVCDNLVKIYKVADLEVVALQGLDLLVEPGEFIALVGASGSGKSTLMNILGGLDVPSAGRAVVDGHVLGQMGRRERTALPPPGDRLRLAADGAQPAALSDARARTSSCRCS